MFFKLYNIDVIIDPSLKIGSKSDIIKKVIKDGF